eukprot:gene7620-10167_t
MNQPKNTLQRLWDWLTPNRIALLYGIAFILASAFFHLLDGKDLYIMYPAECWDLFKYSPAFALFMGVFAWLPDIAGLTLWNLLNAMLLTSIQNAQSNGLIAGLILLAFNKLENGDVRWSSLFITLTVFIKLFGL